MIKKFRGDYKWLSNMTPCKLTYNGIEYPSSEHAYMSAKSDDMTWKSLCADKQKSGFYIKRESQKIALIDDWDNIKFSVMEEILRIKFESEPFKRLLQNTGNVEIQEGNTWNDLFWGVDLETGKGKNNLGKIIMKIRNEKNEL